MPQTPHIEKHFTSTEVVRDIVIGMSDGLTVPFALAAGLTGVIAASHVIITAGLAEVAEVFQSYGLTATGSPANRGALQTVLIGGIAAAFLIAWVVSGASV